MSVRLLQIGGSVSLVFLLCSGVASGAEPDEKVKSKVRALVVQGQQAMRDKRYPEALNRFQEAFRLWSSKEIRFNLALVYLDMGDKIAAATHLRAFLNHAGTAARTALPPVFKALLGQVGVLRVFAPKPKATIWIGGRRVGAGRVELVLLPGLHRIEVRLGKRILAQRKLRLTGGQEILWSPTLMVPRPPPPPLIDKPRGIHWGYFVAATVVAAAAGGSLVYTGLRTRELEREYDNAPSLNLRSEGKLYMGVTNVLIGIAGAAAIGAVLLAIYTRWRKKPNPERAVILPGVAAQGVAISLRLRY